MWAFAASAHFTDAEHVKVLVEIPAARLTCRPRLLYRIFLEHRCDDLADLLDGFVRFVANCIRSTDAPYQPALFYIENVNHQRTFPYVTPIGCHIESGAPHSHAGNRDTPYRGKRRIDDKAEVHVCVAGCLVANDKIRSLRVSRLLQPSCLQLLLDETIDHILCTEPSRLDVVAPCIGFVSREVGCRIHIGLDLGSMGGEQDGESQHGNNQGFHQ